MLTEGFIMWHRQIIDWQWYTDIPVHILFEHLVLTANWYDSEWHNIKIKRGQKVTSREHLSSETGLSEQQVRTALKKLQKTGEITIKTTNKYSLITIVNYDFYQTKDGLPTSKVTNKQPTTNQQITNNQPQINNINNKLNKNKLNNLYKYIKGEKEEFENLEEKDRISIIYTLKRLELYIEDDSIFPEDKIFELKLKYYAITQLYKSSYSVYLNDLTMKLFTLKYLDAQKYCPIESDDEISDFMSYLIVCLRKELKK